MHEIDKPTTISSRVRGIGPANEPINDAKASQTLTGLEHQAAISSLVSSFQVGWS